MTTVLVYGGRDWTDVEALEQFLDAAHLKYSFTRLVHGGARGADQAAGRWAETRCIPVTVFYAQWRRDGMKAGPIRNQKMLIGGKMDIAIQFPGGTGTADMRRRIDSENRIRVIEWKS